MSYGRRRGVELKPANVSPAGHTVTVGIVNLVTGHRSVCVSGEKPERAVYPVQYWDCVVLTGIVVDLGGSANSPFIR